jgi:phosphonate transport system ATP-binding protein
VAGNGKASAAALELRGVSVPGRDRPRLQGIDLVLRPGERVALLGPSGAGKSTLLAVANGLLTPTTGEVFWQGEPPSRSPRQRRRQQVRIGTLWQDLRLIEELTVQQNLNTARLARWGWPKGVLNLLLALESEACASCLVQLDLDPSLLPVPVSALSGGQRQRVAIARLLRQEPTLELLDLLLEHSQGSRALLLSLHRPDLLAGFDRVLALRQGQLLWDRPAAAVTAADLESLYETASMGPTP